jgi:hypothetical protein
VKPTWFVFLAAGMMSPPLGGIRDRDLIYDDEGYRYEVGQAQWNATGYKLVAIRLEA